MTRSALFGAFVFPLIGACASVSTLPADYQLPEPLAPDVVAAFCSRPEPSSAALTLIDQKKSFRIHEVAIDKDPGAAGDETPITFEYYEQSSAPVSPLVLLLPILNGQKHIMRPFAAHFARHGYAVVIVDTVQRRTLLDDLKNPEAAIRQSVKRHRMVLDWAETRAEIDAERLAVFGASLGGFNAFYLAAFDERISAAAFALVGGSLTDVLMNSDERRIEAAVTGVRDELSLDDAELSAYFDREIQTDPLAVAPHVNADRVMMVLAKFDKAVPYTNQERLYEAMGRPEAVTLPTGHITAAVYIFYLRSRVRKFFDRVLARESGYGTATFSNESCRATMAGEG